MTAVSEFREPCFITDSCNSTYNFINTKNTADLYAVIYSVQLLVTGQRRSASVPINHGVSVS